jgi:periplasmic protein TonB
MLKSLLFLFLPFLPIAGFSQEADSVYKYVDVPPSFPGGSSATLKWIRENIRIPQQALDEGFTGRIAASFIVEKDGTITHVEIRKTSSPELDLQLKKTFESMPKWIPAQHNGQIVRSEFHLPVIVDFRE